MTVTWNSVRSWVWRLLKASVVLAAVAGVVYWVKLTPVTVVEHRIRRGPIVAEVMGTGTLEARVQATISPKISGRIAEVLVDQGNRVSAGDLLVRLDDQELRQQVAIAQANLEATEAAIERLQADKRRASAVLEQSQKSHDRVQSLIERNAASQDDLDKAVEALSIAVSGVSQAEAAITEGQKEQVAAQRTLEYHQARLNDTEIQAPFDGMVVKRSRESGDVVVPGSSVLTLISTDELWIRAWVDETEMARLQAGQSARVVFRSEPDRSYRGTVIRLGREADRETREFIVDVRVLELPTNWAVGQRAEAFIEVAQKEDVVLLPAELVVNRDGEAGVFVDDKEVAVWQKLVLGLRNRDAVEVLEGLQAGDPVIKPRESLRNGRRVRAR